MSDLTRNLDDEIKALNFSNYIIPLHELVEYTIHALKKTSSRTDKDIVVLREYVKKSPFLKATVKKYDAFVGTELCHRLEYRFFPAGHRLITAGIVGQAVFILLQGAVQVIPQASSKSESSSLPSVKCIENATGSAYGEIDRDEDGEYKPNKVMVICHQDSHFATISRREYEKILMLFRKKKLDEQIAFLSSLSFFKGWAPHLLKPWADAFENKEIYLRKRVVYKQGDFLKNIYVIKSGNILCTKALPVQGGIIGGHEVGIDDQNQVFLVDNETLCRNVEIAKLGPGQVLGDEEALEAYILAREKDVQPVHESKRDQDAEALSARKRMELINGECTKLRRQTTMTVESLEAEIWSIPIAEFFANLEAYEAEFRIIAELIGDKKRRRDMRISTVLNNSKEFTGFLKTQKTATLKKDLVSTIKTRKFNRSTADAQQGNNSPVNNETTGTNGDLESPQHNTSPYNFTTAMNMNDSRRVASPTSNHHGSRSRSPKREEIGNQGFYETLNRQESLRSSITNAWSPVRGSKERSPKNQKREREKMLGDSPKFTEKIEESREEEFLLELNQSIEQAETKMTPVAEIRTSQQIPIFNSRTSYIGYTIEKKRQVHDKFVQNGVYSRPGTTYYVRPDKTESKGGKRSLSKMDTSANNETVDRSQGPLKWRLMVANSDAKKRADFLATLSKNISRKQDEVKAAEAKGPDGKNMITATYRKLSRDAVNTSGTGGVTPVLKPETAVSKGRGFPDIGKGNTNRVNQSFSRFDRNKSRDECYSPALELNASLRHNDSLMFEDDNKHVGSDVYLISSESEETLPAYPKGSLHYMITTMGRKASKDEVREEQERRKCYLSTLFPGFRAKSMIKKEMDLGELYRLSLKAEAEARTGKIASRQKRKHKKANMSVDQASREKIKKEGMMIQDVIMNKRIKRQGINQGKQGF